MKRFPLLLLASCLFAQPVVNILTPNPVPGVGSVAGPTAIFVTGGGTATVVAQCWGRGAAVVSCGCLTFNGGSFIPGAFKQFNSTWSAVTYLGNHTPGNDFIICATGSGTGTIEINALEIVSGTSTPALDATSTNSGTGVNADGGTATTTNQYDVIVSAVSTASASANIDIKVASGFSVSGIENDGSANLGGAGSHKIVLSYTGNLTPQFTLTNAGTSDWAGATAAIPVLNPTVTFKSRRTAK